MEFKKENLEKNYIEDQLSTPPTANIFTKEQFEDRVTQVFDILYETLAKSFGPGGAGTFVSIFPAYYNTKDGFNIMKNIAFDKKIDQVISDMILNISTRLNFTVGDGTTTATIASRHIYNAYIEEKEFFENNRILPREILKKLEEYKNIILSHIRSRAKFIDISNKEELEDTIRKVSYISSNGNEEITECMTMLYGELMYPAITSKESLDGSIRAYIINGFKARVGITDKLYINNDNNTCILNDIDVIMFGHKVTRDSYLKILKPLSASCLQRKRRLLCIAPFYDENALNGFIANDLNNEFRQNGTINLVLATCGNIGNDKVLMNDLAMLLNTSIINVSKEDELIALHDAGNIVENIYNIDFREIAGTHVPVFENPVDEEPQLILMKYDEKKFALDGKGDAEHFCVIPYHENIIDKFRIGYCDKADIGSEPDSLFTGFYYDEAQYELHINDAKRLLADTESKAAKNGVFGTQILEAQKRLYSLNLKTGVFEYGATSQLSSTYIKDTVDDCIKATSSAYYNGILPGCNLSIISTVAGMIGAEENNSKLDKKLLEIILGGFISVYKTVLSNALGDEIYVIDSMKLADKPEDVYEDFTKRLRKHTKNPNILIPIEIFEPLAKQVSNMYKGQTTMNSIIISASIMAEMVFDLSIGDYSHDVINSAETDSEILKATVDLLALLVTGNQLVMQ